jgi:hypothetical protein
VGGFPTLQATTPSASRTSIVAAAPVTFNLQPGSIVIDGNRSADDMAADLVAGLKRRARAITGSNAKLSAALDRM